MKRYLLYAILMLALILVVSNTFADVGEFSLSWWTIDSGGGASQSGENLELLGAIGQPDADPGLWGNAFAVMGGFLPPEQFTPVSRMIYLPIVIR